MHHTRKTTLAVDYSRLALTWGTLLLMAAALLLGGATREGAGANMTVRLLSLPIILLAAWRLALRPPRAGVYLPLAVLTLIVAVPFLQLVPLPPGLWAALPGRTDFVQAYAAAGIERPSMPFSLAPEATLNAGLALLPGVAMFLAVLSLDIVARMRIAALIVVLAFVSILLGVAQVAGGQESGLRPYETTNDLAAVGFFANRNHLAALLLASLPLAMVWALFWWRQQGVRRLTILAIGAAGVAAVVVGVGAVQSRAGILLLAPAALGCVLLAFRAGVARMSTRPALVLALAAGLAVVVFQFAAVPLLEAVSSSFREDSRAWTGPIIAKGAMEYLPLGTGLGAFDPVYRTLEQLETLTSAFLNHAHNDYLELWLEAGLVAAVLLALFIGWYAARALDLWRSYAPWEDLGRAASIVILLLLLHSAVDYPLRTAAMMTVFAFACACLIEPPPLLRRGIAEASDDAPKTVRRRRRSASGRTGDR